MEKGLLLIFIIYLLFSNKISLSFLYSRQINGCVDGQRCIVVRHLSDYDIAKITIGQFAEDRQIWSGTFTFM